MCDIFASPSSAAASSVTAEPLCFFCTGAPPPPLPFSSSPVRFRLFTDGLAPTAPAGELWLYARIAPEEQPPAPSPPARFVPSFHVVPMMLKRSSAPDRRCRSSQWSSTRSSHRPSAIDGRRHTAQGGKCSARQSTCLDRVLNIASESDDRRTGRRSGSMQKVRGTFCLLLLCTHRLEKVRGGDERETRVDRCC